MKLQNLRKVEVKSQAELRAWFLQNFELNESVWIITYKKLNTNLYLPYSSLVDECLCFGWIDSLPKKLDAERTMHLISPRRSKSGWSEVNKRKIESLIASQKMHSSGLIAVETAKKNGSWNLLNAASLKNIPKDLEEELLKFSCAMENFENFPPSAKRSILEWIEMAKTPETRTKRCKATAEAARENKRVLEWKPKVNTIPKQT